MGLLIRFLLKNMAERKMRTFLVLFSIAVTSALFFASGAVTDTMMKMTEDRYKQISGAAELVIQPKADSAADQFISLTGTSEVKNETDFIIGTLQGSALYSPNKEDMTYAAVLGISFEDLKLLNPVSIYQQSGIEPFEGDKVLISKKTAKKFSLNAGDSIELEIAGSTKKYTVAGLCNPKGLFIDESRGTFMIMPRETLDTLYNAGDKVNTIYVKLKDPQQLQSIMDELAGSYKDCSIREPYDKKDLGQGATPYKLVSMLVIFMGVFIVFTSFKVIALERLPVVGTFRSIGATRKTTNRMLLLESLLYGVIGGIAGCVLGIGALYIMAVVSNPNRVAGLQVTISYKNIQFVYTFVFAVVMSLASAWIPAAGISKIPLKDVILNTMQRVVRKKKLIVITSVLMLAASLVMPRIIPQSPMLILIIDDICMVMALTSVILLVPYLTQVVSGVLERIFPLIFGNAGMLAAKNIRGNKSLINNITLLTIGISSLLLIYSINYSAAKEVANVYANTTRFDITMSYRQADDDFVGSLKSIDGIGSVSGNYEMYGVEVPDRSQYINCLYGIDKKTYLEFWNVQFPGDSIKKLEQLDTGRNVLLSNIMREKFNVSEGNIITLDLVHSKQKYKVTGFFDTVLNNGNMALISGDNMKRDGDYSGYSNLYIKTKTDADKVKTILRGKYGKDILNIMTLKEQLKANQEGLGSVFAILIGFSQLAMLIGVIGVINNLIVCFIERKRYFAVYRSVGMSKRMLGKMLIIESVTSGFLGAVFGLLAAIAMLNIIPFILKLMLGPIKMHYSLPVFIWTLASGMIIMFAASVIPVLKSSKMSIVQSIKYE